MRSSTSPRCRTIRCRTSIPQPDVRHQPRRIGPAGRGGQGGGRRAVRVLVVVQPLRRGRRRGTRRGGGVQSGDAVRRIEGASRAGIVAGSPTTTFSPVYLRNATAYGFSRRLRADIVVNNLVGHAVTTGKVMLQSDGSPWRPLVHVLDIAHAFAQALVAPREVDPQPGVQRRPGRRELPRARCRATSSPTSCPTASVDASPMVPRPTFATTASISPRSSGSCPATGPQWTAAQRHRAALGGVSRRRHDARSSSRDRATSGCAPSRRLHRHGRRLDADLSAGGRR